MPLLYFLFGKKVKEVSSVFRIDFNKNFSWFWGTVSQSSSTYPNTALQEKLRASLHKRCGWHCVMDLPVAQERDCLGF